MKRFSSSANFLGALAATALAPAVLTLTVLALGGLVACSDPAPKDDPTETTAPAESASVRPNLLLITVDTLRADRLGIYGHTGAETPAMDGLGKQGAVAAQALSHVPMTLPSHASLLTGRLPFRHGVRNNGTYKLGDAETTLAEILQTAGYDTAAALGAFVLLEKFGLGQGFDTYDDDLDSDHVLRVFDTEIPADRVVEKWRTWRGTRRDSTRPFFYWAHFYDPHLPYAPPEPYNSKFADPYDGEIAFVDAQIGAMLADLEKDGILQDTYVVVTSDHGEAFGEHGETGHGLTAYQPALHVPLILRGPGIEPGQTIDTRLGLVDLMPTFLQLLEVPLPAGADLDGLSFEGLLRGGESEADRQVYFETLLGQEDRNWAPLTGLYSEDRKLISVPRPELYDLTTDPGETRNLVTAERRTYRRLDESLQGILLGTEAGEARELTAEDRAKLESLGYVSTQGKGRGRALDPKDGLEMDARLRVVEGLITRDPERASRELDSVSASYPDQVLPSFFLFEHRIALVRGDVDKAVDALQRGIQALPDIYPLRYELVRYLIDRERFAEAEQAGRELVELHPDLSQGWILLGRCYEVSDLEKAVEVYERGLELEPGNFKLAARLADIQSRLGDVVGALGRHDELIRRGYYDDKPEQIFKTAMLHMSQGNGAEAETLFATGLSRRPQGFYYMSYALVLERNGKRGEAMAALESALAPSLVGDLTEDQARLARTTLERWSSTP